MAELSGLPGVEASADAAFSQMLQAFETRTRTYPMNAGSHGDATQSIDAGDPHHLSELVACGARNDGEVHRIGVLVLLGALRRWPEPNEDGDCFARALLWTEGESQLPILTLLVRTLDAPQQLRVAALLQRVAQNSPDMSRGQQSLALLWGRALSGDAVCLQTVQQQSSEITSCAPPHGGLDARLLRGRILSTPRGPILTALAAFSGWMLIRHLVCAFGRLVLAYRAQAELDISDHGIEVREHTSLLGRKLRDRTHVIALHAVRSLSREVRYARAGTYAGLGALAVGSFVGMRLFVDGVRAPGFSGPTIVAGLIVVLAGLGLDFALATWLDSSRTRCRLLIQTVHGRGLYLNCEEPAQVEGMLSELARRLTP
jgi:hypothetical protein